MRVALLSYNAQFHNAVGNHVAEKVRFFQEHGAEVRLFVQDARRLHPDVRSCTRQVTAPEVPGLAWDYLRQADLVFAIYGQHHDLLQFLPALAGTGPRIVFDYLGVTPPEFASNQHRETLEQSVRRRGYVWCCDHALTTSDANRRELLDATNFPPEHVTTLPLAVNTERFRPDVGAKFLQRKLGIDGRILLYVGRLAANKRVPLLIEALARVEIPSLHVVVVGDCGDIYAEEAAHCVRLAQELGVGHRVHLLGELDDDDLARTYQSADALVLPSLHEGFCVPVIEAMAAGCPVIASRSAALPETVGAAGLTFTPDDADALARQICRVLTGVEHQPATTKPRRVAVVSFRFGSDIVGGAETSLRTMAQALQTAGHHVEVFTTCTTSESDWKNDVPAGSTILAGLTVNRFAIDPHDHHAHGEVVRALLQADGNVPTAVADRYLAESIHSAALVQALRERQDDFDAIITGPYLFGLTASVVCEFHRKVLLAPCFHDEALARLDIWPRLYGNAGGILYHSAEEREFAHTRLGVNHPNSAIVGTCISLAENALPDTLPANLRRPYVVYCGRYSEQKNVPLLIEWARRYQTEHPNRLDFVFMGKGEVRLPEAPWLQDLGFVPESAKHAVLAGATALIQLSRQESLSLVALEAWAQGTPVIVHQDCAVLAAQVERSQGGVAVADYQMFAAALEDLWTKEPVWRRRGENGRAFVAAHYLSAREYSNAILSCIDSMSRPIAEQMRERGLERSLTFTRDCWQRRFAEFVEHVLTQPARAQEEALRIEPLRRSAEAVRTRTLLLPIRFRNEGTRAAAPDGPGRTVVCSEIRTVGGALVVDSCTESPLPSLVMPGQSCVAAVSIETPAEEGSYDVHLWTERADAPASSTARAAVNLSVHDAHDGQAGGCVATFLDALAHELPKAHHLQQLPADYVDVTEGHLAPVKRFVKKKLLHNFKHAYVDVLSRQQSQVNGHLVLMIQQLTECCTMFDPVLAGLCERVEAFEKTNGGLEGVESAGDFARSAEVHG